MESLNKQEIGFLKEQITDLKNQMTAGFATINAKLELLSDGYVKKEELEKYVTEIEFSPVRKIVYGAVSLVLTAVFGALIYLVIKN